MSQTTGPDGFLNDNGGLNGGESDASVAVTRFHWRRETGNDVCAAPGCARALSGPALRVAGLVVAGAGRRNCAKCGDLFCDAHTMFQMRLAPADARHDPVTGVWCRVCQSCYEGREGYSDCHGEPVLLLALVQDSPYFPGVSRKRTVAFLKARKPKTDLAHLEANKLEKRLEKVDNIYLAVVNYLQSHMFTLQLLPKTTTETMSELDSKLTADERERLAAASSALEALEAQEDQLRGFIEDATRRRRLEDAASLREALADVVAEVDRLKGE
ncbi:carboxypeptidase Y-deficient, partial [Cladochytrium tenue]